MSRLSEIWQTHEDQWQRIEELEKTMEEAVMRKRRRIANLLDELPSSRKSHLRFFCSHKRKDTDDDKERDYEIIVEGKLLVGHLDHLRAKQIDDSLYGGQINPSVDPSDRSQYRGGIAERESDIPIEPIHFTHLFDDFQANIYTVYQPSGITPSKRQKNKRSSASVEEALQTSETTTLLWRREISSTEQPSLVATSPDSHAFILPYKCPKPPSSDMRFHSVVVELCMLPRAGDDTLYQPSPALSKALFPQHKNTKNISAKLGKRIPNSNDIQVPSLLTMKEVVLAFFHYIQFHNLQDDDEPSMIKSDKLLQSLLETPRFNFADLQFFLTSKNLIVDASKEPSYFTHVFNDGDLPNILTLDMDVFVPSLFHYRCRELLRRIKQREFEYTSSRTKARNWLGSPSDELVRTLLEECVTGQGYTTNHIGAWLALARAAPEGSEARQTAQLDAQICYLLQQAQECATTAQAAWTIAEAVGGDAVSTPTEAKEGKDETITKDETTTREGEDEVMEESNSNAGEV